MIYIYSRSVSAGQVRLISLKSGYDTTVTRTPEISSNTLAEF